MTKAYLGEHDLAIPLFRQALTFAPNDGAILAALAASYEATERLDEAMSYAEEALRASPEQSEYAYQLAQLYLRNGASDRAEATLERLFAADSSQEDALYELAYIRQSTGDTRGAIATFARIENRFGPSMSVKYRTMQLQRSLGDETAAEATLREMIAIEPNDVALYRMLGETFMARDRLAEAEEAYEIAQRLEPANFEVVFGLMNVYRRGGRTAEADTLLAQTLAIESATDEQRLAQARFLFNEARRDSSYRSPAVALLGDLASRTPPNEEALIMLGELQLASASYRDAGESLYRALTINPRSPEHWERSAWAFWQGGLSERAFAVADEGLLLFPGDVDLMRIAGYALLEQNRNTEALAMFEEAVAELELRTPADPMLDSDLSAALGLLYDRLDRTEASDQWYERAIEKNAEHALALNNYAYSLAVRGVELQKARRMAERAIALSPDNASFLDTLGWVYFVSGDYRQALSRLDEAVALEGAGATVFEHHGDTLARLGRSDEAKASWEKGLLMDPTNAALRRKLGQ
jgi:tetratricopeptide (TPR) repeat protein